MDFANKVLWIIDVFGVEIWITQTIVNTWLIMACLILFAIFVRVASRQFRAIPTGFQNAVEALIELIDNFVLSAAGEKLTELGPWFFMVAVFIFTSNISGVVGLRPPTADWATTFAFALCTFFLTQIMAFKYRKTDYLKSFLRPVFLFLPLNIISELAKPVSLSFRLFGNMLSGLILMNIVYTMPVALRFAIPVPLHAYFDLAIGGLQTYIFCMLSMSFIRNAVSSGDGE